MKTLLRSCAEIVTRRLRRFAKDTRGNFAIILGLGALPLIGFSGLALDYGGALTAKSRLDSAADSAALAAVIETARIMQLPGTNRNTGWPVAAKAGQDRGDAAFRPTAGSAIDTSAWSIVMTRAGGTVTANVTYSTSVPTSFSKLLGLDTISVSGTRVASQTFQRTTQYTQIVFLLDNSNSMAIGGDASSITQLDGTLNCRFACHDSKWSFSCKQCAKQQDLYSYVRTNLPDVKLKFDYLKSALDDFIMYLDSAGIANDPHLIISVQTFGTYWNKLVTESSSLVAVQNAVRSLNIEDATDVHNDDLRTDFTKYGKRPGFTNTSDGMTKMLASLTSVGNGSSSSSRKTFVVLITDGVEDVCTKPVCSDRIVGQMFDPTVCKAVKDAGVTLITVATPYPVLTGSIPYNTYVAPIAGKILPAMQDCSSDSANFFFEADDGAAIRASAAKIFTAIQQRMAGNPVLVK